MAEIEPKLRPTPRAEIELELAAVRAMLRAQHPDLAELPLRRGPSGWDNASVRLGDELCLRLPRRALGAELIEHELRWLPELAAQLPVAVPAAIRVGRPGQGYPWRWAIVPWIAGETAEHSALDERGAAELGAFLRCLHDELGPPPKHAPDNSYRGHPLRARAADTGDRLARLAAAGVELGEARELWTRALDAPMDRAPTWLHADLHPRNLIVDGGRLAGVIDWGDLCSGDPACDLACAWMVLDAEHRPALWARYGSPSPATCLRARGWALVFAALMLEAGSRDDPEFAILGRRILARALEA